MASTLCAGGLAFADFVDLGMDKTSVAMFWYKPFKFYTGFYRREVLLHKILQRPFVYGDIGFQAC